MLISIEAHIWVVTVLFLVCTLVATLQLGVSSLLNGKMGLGYMIHELT